MERVVDCTARGADRRPLPAGRHTGLNGVWRGRLRSTLATTAFVAALPAAAPDSTGGNARSVLDLQPARQESTAPIGATGLARLIELNPVVNEWYVLEVELDGITRSFHLENPQPDRQRVTLLDSLGSVLEIERDGVDIPCTLFAATTAALARVGSESERAYVTLCDGRLLLRKPTTGARTRREWAADLLRDRVRHGEAITGFVKERFYRDRYLRKSVRETRDALEALPILQDSLSQVPKPLATREEARGIMLRTPGLDLPISPQRPGRVVPGAWYRVEGQPHVFVAAITPDLVADSVAAREAGRTSPLDEVEAAALVYLVAFDLDRLQLGFEVGTEHPRVGWSDRVPAAARRGPPQGPDGFETIRPLVRTGKVTPHDVPRVVATFAGGFKRSHGAFRWGELSLVNGGSHYGFMEHGTVLSTLQPDLATILVYVDGRVELRTWRASDAWQIPILVHARQNGVPLLELDPEGKVVPGSLVRDWSRGNWSGSETKQLRTLRAGVCLQSTERGRFLVYGYFSSATPSAMARVFDACGCDYAMHLDMNAPEHTYLALYRNGPEGLVVDRLVEEMLEVDPPVDGQEVPRFVAYPSSRDFFYLLPRDEEIVR